MASVLYPNYKDLMLGYDSAAHALPDWDTDTIKCAIANSTTDYTYSAAHQDWADVAAYSTDTCYGGESTVTISGISITSGVVDATDTTFVSVAIDGTKDVDLVLIYLYNAAAASAPLMIYYDLIASPVTPNSGDIVVQYHGSGLFTL